MDLTEQLVLQQLLRQGRAIQHDERPVTPRTPSMNLARKNVFAGATFAGQENCRVGGRGAFCCLEQRNDSRILRF